MRTCPCCGREAELSAVSSVIDFATRKVCPDCFDNNAEPQEVVRDAAVKELLTQVTVFERGAYVNAAEWLATAQDEEPEDDQDEDKELLA